MTLATVGCFVCKFSTDPTSATYIFYAIVCLAVPYFFAKWTFPKLEESKERNYLLLKCYISLFLATLLGYYAYRRLSLEVNPVFVGMTFATFYLIALPAVSDVIK